MISIIPSIIINITSIIFTYPPQASHLEDREALGKRMENKILHTPKKRGQLKRWAQLNETWNTDNKWVFKKIKKLNKWNKTSFNIL